MLLLDLLGRRWALRMMWELRDGPLTFRELRMRCDEMSPSVLNQRLSELRGVGVIGAPESGGYRLTGPGRELARTLMRLDKWAERHLAPP